MMRMDVWEEDHFGAIFCTTTIYTLIIKSYHHSQVIMNS